MALDYRLTENREEAFIKWFHWSIIYDDCDPAIFMTNYLFDRFEHNREQKLWIAWLYGTTYYFPTTWVIWNEFPDFELVDQARIDAWNTANFKRLRYQTDTKYNKGHLGSQYKSYREWTFSRGTTQESAFASLLQGSDQENFKRVFEEVSGNLYKFGRYTTWFYLQTLKQCCGMNIDPPNLILEDYSGSRSHRNGLCYAVGKDDWVDQKLSDLQIAHLNKRAAVILEEVKRRVAETRPSSLHLVDYFTMETALCSFKKIFRVNRGRYLGYYLDRQAEEISTVEKDGWDGIFWKPLWDSRNEHPVLMHHPELREGRVVEGRMSHFVDFGTIERLEFLYPDDIPTMSSLESFFGDS
jgi:hypothetical protein